MAKFSVRSNERLATCHYLLQVLFNEVITEYDCTILEGHRTRERQKKLFELGKTKVQWSNHNNNPSTAVDAAPWPIPEGWGEAHPKELARFYHFGGYVLGVADRLHISMRWGGDWNGNKTFRDQTFDDLVHFELK